MACQHFDNNFFISKNKSVVGRGIAGGLLFGPVGAMLGGMSGIGSTQRTVNTRVIAVAYKDKSGEIQNIIGKLPEIIYKTEPLEREFCDYFNRKYNPNYEILESNEDGDVFLLKTKLLGKATTGRLGRQKP